MNPQLTETTFWNKDVVKEEVVQNASPNVRPMVEGVEGSTLNERMPIEHLTSIARNNPVSTTGKENNSKLHDSEHLIILQNVYKASKREKITQEPAIVEGISNILKEIADIKNQMHDMKTDISENYLRK